MPEDLPQSDIDALLAIMKREAIKQRRYNRIAVLFRIVQAGLFLALLIAVLGLHQHLGGFAGVINILNLIPAAMLKRMNNERRKNTVAELTKVNDVRIVGPLCDALGFGDNGMTAIAQDTLVEILPRLQASDAPLLNSEQRSKLYRTLTGGNKPLIFATLKALEQIGDEKAVPIVEKLAGGIPIAMNRDVREAAEHCLPFLRERANALKAGQELLRASAPDVKAETLLRPASSQQTEPQELLRASRKEIA